MAEKLTAEQRVHKANLDVMRKENFRAIAGVIMLGRTRVVDSHPLAEALGVPLTAATDGRDVVYGRKFVESLTDEELRFLILHENYHKAFRHLSTWRHLFEQNPQVANGATDTVINLMLLKQDNGEGFIMMPHTPWCDKKFEGMDTGRVFRLLMQELKDSGGQGKGKRKGGKGSQQQPGGGGGEDGFDLHDWGGAEELSKEEQQELEVAIDRALRQGALLAGKGAGGLDRQFADLLEPKINWKEVLREFVQQICKAHDYSTWRRPNRRMIDQGIYMPSATGESVGRIVIAIDTSGSIGGDQLTDFLTEVIGIAKSVTPELVDLLYWDTRVAGHEKYGPGDYDQIATSTKPKGGGGTDCNCVPDYLRANKIKPECVIVLTDGYVGGWGTYDWPVLFVITTKGIIAPVGKSLYLE